MVKRIYTLVLAVLLLYSCTAAHKSITSAASVTTIPVDTGWAKNSINVTVFRKNSLVTFRDTQFIAYYNADSYVVIGKRKIGSHQWQLQQTPYKGHTADAHNIISIMMDGEGYLHMAWDHHNNSLHYCRSIAPGSLQLTGQLPMTGMAESRVSYPEFYRMPNGNLLFLYRDGGSGNGSLVINHYQTSTKQWTQLHTSVVDGEGQRSAYWQACVDNRGTIHLSWVWRETPDVASNHDMCYAQSVDGGHTWQTSNGVPYTLPITAATAEYAVHIPQNSELINQTAMFADAAGHPYIATYWRERGDMIPQYHLIYSTNGQWHTQNLGFRKTAFSLRGAGSKRIPISRPQIVAWLHDSTSSAALIFRDEEQGNRVMAAVCNDIHKNNWKLTALSTKAVGSWEPTYDTELWKNQKIVDLFVEKVEQVDAEGIADMPPQPVEVLEWRPIKKE